MLKNISNLGKVINKTQQKSIKGGLWEACSTLEIHSGCVDTRFGCVCTPYNNSL